MNLVPTYRYGKKILRQRMDYTTYKRNVLYEKLHFSENKGFRIESEVDPDIVSVIDKFL